MNKIIGYMISLFALFFVGCNNEVAIEVSPEQSAEVLFSGCEDDFVLTKANPNYLIGKDGTAKKFGTFYILQTKEDIDGELHWGRYIVNDGKEGQLTLKDGTEDEKLIWEDGTTNYLFRSISVPPGIDSDNPGVVFNLNEMTGTVTFGDYTTGLEYFMGVTVGPQSLANGQVLSMTYKRQVCKVVFWAFYYEHADGTIDKDIVTECQICFPNLPVSATFDMKHFHKQQSKYNANEPIQGGCDYVTLDFKDRPKAPQITWRKNDPDASEKSSDIFHAFYLPPFKFWDGKDSKPENQSGFFVVTYNGKTYTGNINGYQENNTTHEEELKKLELFASDFCRLTITLKDGSLVGGGGGSAIAEWNVEDEKDVSHHRVPGIYSQEDADKLLDALINKTPIPEVFFDDDIIRLFTNIDWSSVEGITIPDGYTLDGQGYNIKMSESGTIEGNYKNLYINGAVPK